MEKKKIRKVLKIILIVALIALAIVVIHIIRNFIIITNLQSKISEYSNSTNYYTKSVANENNGIIITMKYYKKDNKQAVFLERNLNGEITKMSMYNNGERTDLFIEATDSKIAQLNSETMMSVDIYNQLETENSWQTFLGSIFSSVKSTKYNGKDCYAISNFMSSNSLSYDKQTVYIDKDTGLSVKNEIDKIVTEREYEFNNVEDSIFVEPDISQYTLKENN